MELVSINLIKPADYNPRVITEESRENLSESLKELGFVLPIIVNRDNMTIIAGHQRTTCAKNLGYNQVPCYFTEGHISKEEEILFNQLHNGTEGEPEDVGILNADIPKGFHDSIPIECFDLKGQIPLKTLNIAKLIMKFGNVFCAIVVGNEVMVGNSYLYACKSLGCGCNVSKLDSSGKGKFKKCFSKEYGKYNYDKLEKFDFVQGLAQMNRTKLSVLYERLVVPFVTGKGLDTHVLDFGCGKGLCKNSLIQKGYENVIGVEFFNHNKASISISRGQRLVSEFFNDVRHKGLYDVVVCDSVVNSLVSMEAVNSVFDCLNIFVKEGGTIFFSGRRIEDERRNEKRKWTIDGNRPLQFFDENGFSGRMRRGVWYFQLFLNKGQVDELCTNRGWIVDKCIMEDGFYLQVRKTRDLGMERNGKALDYEFNLKLPGGSSYGREEEARELFKNFCEL